MNIKLDNLEINNYMIYQDKDSISFGIDAVLLANFALRENGIVKNDASINICDLCSGNIPIPLIMYAKREKFLNNNIKITAVEINSSQTEVSKKTLLYNSSNVDDAKNILGDIDIINDDIKNILTDKLGYKKYYGTFDIITVNPPYIKKGSGIINVDDSKLMARHEISITFEEICKASSLLIKSNKKFYIINHSDRITEMIRTLKKYDFECKKLQFIYPFIYKSSNLVLIEAVKGANEGVKVLNPIVVYNEDGSYTDEILHIYGK